MKLEPHMRRKIMNQQHSHLPGPIFKRCRRLLSRSPWLRSNALAAANVLGTLVVLSPLILLVTASLGALNLFAQSRGPLDMFFGLVSLAIAAFCAWLSLQLYQLHPNDRAGVELAETDTPELFGILQRRIQHFRIKPVSHIIATTEAELRIAATPRWPMPLLHKHSLHIGIPLLFFLGRTQFRAVLAGAAAHATHRQKTFSGWLEQACDDWPLISVSLCSSDCQVARLLEKPVRQINAIIEELSAPMRSDWRQQQTRWILDNSDEKNATTLLANQLVAKAFLEKQYWPMVMKAAERSPAPVVQAFSHLPVLLHKILDKKLADRWLLQSHTALGQRDTGTRDLMAHLCIDHLDWPGLPKRTIFDRLFDSSRILKKMDRYWQDSVKQDWEEAYANHKNDRERFERLRPQQQKLRGDSALRYINLTPSFVSGEEEIQIYRDIVTSNPEDARVCFACGLAMLRASQGKRGKDALNRARSLEPKLSRRVKELFGEYNIPTNTQPATTLETEATPNTATA